MKTLYIVRHAKSSWEYQGIKDIDRPLKKRGIKDAHLVSSFLSKKIDRPDVFVSSSANRALHTAIIFCENLQYPLSNLQIKKQYIKLRKSNFLDITFKEFILTTLNENKQDDLFDNHHPTELSHQKWATYLKEHLNE